MELALVRFQGSRTGNPLKSRIRMLGFLPGADKPTCITLTLGHHGKSNHLDADNLDDEKRNLRLIGIDMFSPSCSELCRIYAPDASAFGLEEHLTLPSFYESVREMREHETAFFIVTFEMISQSSSQTKALSCLSFTQNDIVFIFPNETVEEPFLWASVEALSQASPYWKTMFESGYKESQNLLAAGSAWRQAWKSDLQGILAAHQQSGREALVDMPDSDEYEPPPKRQKRAEQLAETKSGLGPEYSKSEEASMRYIIVQDTPMKTYQAVLTWLLTRCVKFASLRSRRLVLDMSGDPEDDEQDSADHCSPKSVYRLAHLLELHELKKLALGSYTTQITAENALDELFSEASFRYPELQEAAMSAAVKEWDAIKQAGGPLGIKQIVDDRGENTDQAFRVAVDLLARV